MRLARELPAIASRRENCRWGQWRKTTIHPKSVRADAGDWNPVGRREIEEWRLEPYTLTRIDDSLDWSAHGCCHLPPLVFGI